MPQARSNGVTLEYERSGPLEGEPLLLIHGVGAQLVRWPAALLAALEDAGFAVIRFDNRDVGLSTHMDDTGVPDLPATEAAMARGEVPELPYTLSDMAADAAGLLDALGIASAHVFGVSLGGMIAQVLAIDHGARVRSLAIAMSQTGLRDLPPSDPAALEILAIRGPDPSADEAGYLAHSVALNRALGSPAYASAESDLRAFARAAAARGYDPAGSARQLAASRGGPDRRAALRTLDVPTLVIHGADDPLIKLAGGEDIARQIRKAWLLTVHGMGHDLPDDLADLLASTIAANGRRSDRRNRTRRD